MSEHTPHILLVEDSDETREAMALLLTSWGNSVATANSGEACLKMLDEIEPDFVLLDIGLPCMSGYEVAERVRRRPEGDRIKLIAITGFDELCDRQAALAAGFDMHFTKPVDLTHLQMTLNPR